MTTKVLKLSRSKDVIGLDRGHGTNANGGAVGIIREEKLIDEVSSEFLKIAKDRGYKVVELRPSSATSQNNDLYQRVQKAEKSGVTFLLSIHGNAFNGAAHGTEVYCVKGGRGEIFAKQICDNICGKIGTYNRGVKEKNLYVVTKSSMTANLVECLFIDSQADMKLYNPSIIASSIADALLEAPKSLIDYNAQVINVKTFLNVREKPEGTSIGKLMPDEKAQILDEAVYYKVRYLAGEKIKEGWVSEKYMKKL